MQSVTFTQVESLQNILTEILLREWEAQGHSITGRVVKEMEYEVKQSEDTLTLIGLMYPYASIIAAGTKASRIPFSQPSGRGGKSLYIEALQKYVKLRMGIEDDKKSLSIAFAIAQTQKKEGMPTGGSYKYSTTGKRTDFIGEALRKGEDRITEAVRTWTHDQITLHLNTFLDKWQLELNA